MLLGGICSSFGLQLFIGKQSILQTIRQLREKSLSTMTSIKHSSGNIVRDEKKILPPWREYLEDLLNPIRATPIDTCDTINFGKEEGHMRYD